jgi:primosomal protein N' (replication factor Y)
MMAKGHHFAGLALVGVVDADLGLAGGDLRAAERTYQLLHHPVMKALLSGDRETFLKAELQARQNAHMPPFSRLAAIIVEGAKEEIVMKIAKELSRITNHESRITILGPAPAPLYRLRGKFRYRLLARAERNVNLPDFMKQWLDTVKPPSSVRIKVDIDPVSFL